MRISPKYLFKRQKRININKTCLSAIDKYRWPNGFVCSKCGSASAWFFSARQIYQCSKCRHQVSATTVGILLDTTNLFFIKGYLGELYCRINQKFDVSGQPLELAIKKVFSNKKFIWLMAAVVAYSMYVIP